MLRTVQRGSIPSDFTDPYLELLYLLNQAAGLEHSLMSAYLYAALSIKDEYARVRGDITNDSYLQHSTGGPGGLSVLARGANLLEVCIEEMQHLGTVNRFLGALGGAATFVPQEYPVAADIYPFPIVPMTLDRYVAATFLWMEASACTLSLAPECEGQHEPAPFIAELLGVLTVGAMTHHNINVSGESVSHVGTLYAKILAVTREVAQRPPSFLPPDLPWTAFESEVYELMLQGEVGHYRLFRGLYTGEAFGAGPEIWREPRSPAYPVVLLRGGTAYRGNRDTIPDPDARRLAWLSNLHYWIVLCLLDIAYRYADPYDNIQRKYQYKAIDNMVAAFWPLGLALARQGWGVPFDALGTQYALGRDLETALDIVQLLIYEARAQAQALASEGLLPPDYRMDVFDATLDGLIPPQS